MMKKIKMGCGKGQKCSVGLYTLPQAGTKEVMTKYFTERIKTYKKDYNGRA